MQFKTLIANHFDEQISSLQGLLRIPSVEALGENGTPFGQGTKDCLDYCLKLGERLGFRAVNLDDRCGYLEYGEGEELVVVLGHLDVVPEGTGWDHPPYAAELADGRIYARGAIDDKGPMMAALYALRAIAESGETLRRRVRILFGLNEETGCACMEYYVNSGQELPTAGFTPDGEFPIINGEKGICAAHYTYRIQPHGAYLRSFSGGTALNMVPARAAADVVCDGEAKRIMRMSRAAGVTVTETADGIHVEAEGTSAHGSTPEKGVNAITRLARFLSGLPLEPSSEQFANAVARLFAQNTRGEALGIALRDDVSGSMVVNLGTAEIRDGVVTLGVNLRCPVTYGADDFHPRMKASMDALGFAEADFSFTPPLYIPPESPLIQTLCRVYEQETGLDGTPICIGGGTYAKTMPNIVAFGPIFPGEPCVEHEANEFISLESFQKMTEVYAAAIYELAK